MKYTFIVLVALLTPFSSFGTHTSGGNISYQCLGNNQYEFTITIYRDCSGSSSINVNSFLARNSCGFAAIPATSGWTATILPDVILQCPGQISACSNGNAFGVQAYVFKRTYTLSGNCADWIFSWNLCCRSGSIVNGPSNASHRLETRLNNIIASCNNSPTIAPFDPIPRRCLGQTAVYDLSASDPDGDSLTYALVPALSGSGNPVVYNSGFSGTSPIPGITIHPQTGRIVFSPNMIGVFVVAVLISEYDSAGNLIGSVLHDFLFFVTGCNNSSPNPPIAGISNIVGNGSLLDTNRICATEGRSVCFDVLFTDSPQQIITISSNIATILPGATLTQTSWSGSGASATLCFTLTNNAPPISHISIYAIDDGCSVGFNILDVVIENTPSSIPNGALILPNPVQIPCGGPVSFNVFFPAPAPSYNDFSYSWSPGGLLNDSTISNPTTDTLLDTTAFQVIISQIGGCNYDTLNAIVNTYCPSSFLSTFDASCYGYSDGAVSIWPICTTYPSWTFTLYDTTGSVLQSSGAISTSNYIFYNLQAGSYRVETHYTGGCTTDTVINIGQRPSFAVTTSQDTTICQFGTANLDASVTGSMGQHDYHWNHNPFDPSRLQIVTPSVTTCYSVYASDSLGCYSDTQEVCVNVANPILLQVPFDSASICKGDSILLTASATGGDPSISSQQDYNYEWYVINSSLATRFIGYGDSIFVAPEESPSNYSIAVTDNCESRQVISSMVVEFHPTPDVGFLADRTEGCLPFNVLFTNATNPTSSSLCEWDFGDGNTSTNCGTNTHTYDVSGEYSVSLNITNTHGCTNDTTLFDLISIYDYPMADFESDPNIIYMAEPTAQFIDLSSSDAIQFEWWFGTNGELGTSIEQNPVFTFPNRNPDVFDLALIATNSNNCSDTIYSSIIMKGIDRFYVPNGFSPNGDGINDSFYPKGYGDNVLNYDMTIFDRWGNIVFMSTEEAREWNGKNNGSKLPIGVYNWKITYKGSNSIGAIVNFGHVLIID